MHRQAAEESAESGELESGTIEVSVIVPTLDSQAHLPTCLASVRRQEGVRAEVIVVDQQSGDDTQKIARAHRAKVVTAPRTAFYSPPTAARNLGARHATGAYLLHLDADMELPPGVLASCVQTCLDRGFIALVLHEVDIASGFWANCKALERLCYRGVEEVEGARFVRADVFRSVGGYDEELGSGEDWDIHARYRDAGPIGAAPQPLYHHLGRIEFASQLRKKFSYGRTARRFLRKAPGTPIAAAMIRAYWSSRRALLRRPSLALGLIVLRTAEGAALALGMVAGARTTVATQRLNSRR
jgi:glycosyltransferase involved in cell wall biosynthesis